MKIVIDYDSTATGMAKQVLLKLAAMGYHVIDVSFGTNSKGSQDSVASADVLIVLPGSNDKYYGFGVFSAFAKKKYSVCKPDHNYYGSGGVLGFSSFPYQSILISVVLHYLELEKPIQGYPEDQINTRCFTMSRGSAGDNKSKFINIARVYLAPNNFGLVGAKKYGVSNLDDIIEMPIVQRLEIAKAFIDAEISDLTS